MECAKLDHSEMDHAESKHSLHHQNDSEVWFLLGHYAVWIGNSAPTFWGQSIGPSVKGQEIQNREQNMIKINFKKSFLGILCSAESASKYSSYK